MHKNELSLIFMQKCFDLNKKTMYTQFCIYAQRKKGNYE